MYLIIKNQKNKGALYSKSIGALNAKGKYIVALDSDDLFINERLYQLYTSIIFFK